MHQEVITKRLDPCGFRERILGSNNMTDYPEDHMAKARVGKLWSGGQIQLPSVFVGNLTPSTCFLGFFETKG